MMGLGEHVLGGEWTKGLKDDSQEEGLANLVDAERDIRTGKKAQGGSSVLDKEMMGFSLNMLI